MDLIGKTLGNYRIDRLLGEGSTGTVYRAYDLSLEREAAIKVIHSRLAMQTAFRERFLQEARATARLVHPGIIQVYDIAEEGDLLYLSMEFIEGPNLRQLLDELLQEKKWLPLGEAVLLVQQLCDTLEFANQHMLSRRDVKPANLLLKPEATERLSFHAVITDLGMAKALEAPGIASERTSSETLAYISPEQISGQETERPSDVYSLGILCYELAVQRLPFPIRTMTDAVRYHTQEQPPTPSSLRPDLPGAVEWVILKSLQKHPSQRYPSPAHFEAALDGILRSSPEIVQPANQDEVSLLTRYLASVLASKRDSDQPTVKLDSGVTGSTDLAARYIPEINETLLQVRSKDNPLKRLP